MAKKRLTPEEFERVVSKLDRISDQTREIAYGVLVEGRRQVEFVKATGLTKGAIWQAVQRIWKAHLDSPNEGQRRVTAILPEHQAFLVEQWTKKGKQGKR